MAYFPFFIDLKYKKCLIVGGGKVAERKIEKIKNFGADITVIAPAVTPCIENNKELKIIKRKYKEGDETDFFFVIAATDNRDINKIISKRCKEKNILVNVADDPEFCSFLFPAIVKEGKLSVGISTSGSSPTAAIEIKDRIRKMIPPSFDDILDYLYNEREEIKKNVKSESERHEILRKLFNEAIEKKRPLSYEETMKIRKDDKNE